MPLQKQSSKGALLWRYHSIVPVCLCVELHSILHLSLAGDDDDGDDEMFAVRFTGAGRQCKLGQAVWMASTALGSVFFRLPTAHDMCPISPLLRSGKRYCTAC